MIITMFSLLMKTFGTKTQKKTHIFLYKRLIRLIWLIKLKPVCILIFLLLLTTSFSVSASYEYAVLPTQQKAENLLKQLKPLFPEDTKFSAKGYQLIIKASPNIIKEIKYVLKQIDRPLQSFIISIAKYKTIDKLLKTTHVSGPPVTNKTPAKKNKLTHFNNNDDIGQDISKPSGGKVKITSTQRNSDTLHNGIYSARVVEDNWVYIRIGKQVPYYSSGNFPNTGPANMAFNRPYNFQLPQTQFKTINSGFEAKAILQTGNQVLIQIKAQNNHQNKNYQSDIDTSSAYTTISGSINQWIKIGEISQGSIVTENKNKLSNTQKTSSTIQYRNRTNQQNDTYYIKINTIN